MVEFAKQLQPKAMQSGVFFFTTIDTKIDQPQAEIMIDHDKVAALGLNMQQIGADVSAMFGGNFVNRFNIDGRSYKVIPQVEALRSIESGPVEGHLRHRAGQQGHSVEHGREHSRENGPALSQSFQAAERGHDQRRAPRLPLDQVLKLLEDEAAQAFCRRVT